MSISLAFNPSHLEWVNTVVLGQVRARQDRIGDELRTELRDDESAWLDAELG